MSDDFIQLYTPERATIRAELQAGLNAAQAVTSPKYLYDALGSKLFEAICALPEYYPTRTEAAIFTAFAEQIAASVGTGATLIDLGAGNCAKAAQLFTNLRPAQYVPIDISVDFLREAVRTLRKRFPDIAMLGVGMDFSQNLDMPAAVRRQRRLFFYPGSSIGNYAPDQALAYLRRIHTACVIGCDDSNEADEKSSNVGEVDEIGQGSGGSKAGSAGLLIGIDLIKDAGLLDAAYDDALGVTAAFNLNLLRHLNILLDANFDVRDWQHHGFFNSAASRVEMHLEARRALTVSWPGGERVFSSGERIHTESSYKYTQQAFKTLLEQAGFVVRRAWTDPQQWFMVCHASIA
ncbi:MAG: L-histidine N(alpha)-methyltransferase [Pseudomonadota bacterium]